MSNLSSSPTFNFGGIASGLDTNAIVGAAPRHRGAVEDEVEPAAGRRTRPSDGAQGHPDPAPEPLELRRRTRLGEHVGRSTGGFLGGRHEGLRAEDGGCCGRRLLDQGRRARAGGPDDAGVVGDVGGCRRHPTDRRRVDGGRRGDDGGRQSGDDRRPDQWNERHRPCTPRSSTTSSSSRARRPGAANSIAVSDGNAGNAGTLAADLGFTETQAARTPTSGSTARSTPTGRRTSSPTSCPASSSTLKAATSGASVGITVGAAGTNTEAVTSKVQAFVDQYNSTIDFIQSKLDEERVARPQTQSDREKGILRGDTGLSILLSRLRSSATDVVSGRPVALDQLSEIGITTGKSTGSGTPDPNAVAGKLSFDPAEADREARSAGFRDVKALFTNVTGAYDDGGACAAARAAPRPVADRRRDERLDHVLADRGVTGRRSRGSVVG